MTTQPSIGVGVVGYGYWGRHYARIFSDLPDARLVSICDSDVGRRDEAGRRFPGVPTDTALADMLRRPGLDAVVICTPATRHFETTNEAIAAGKHVLVEKPLTTDVFEAVVLT